MRSASWRAASSSSICLGVERADQLFEQEVDGHLHAGERRLQLVADGRDHVALEPVEQVKLGHVNHGDGGAEQLVGFGADRQRPEGESTRSWPASESEIACSSETGK